MQGENDPGLGGLSFPWADDDLPENSELFSLFIHDSFANPAGGEMQPAEKNVADGFNNRDDWAEWHDNENCQYEPTEKAAGKWPNVTGWYEDIDKQQNSRKDD